MVYRTYRNSEKKSNEKGKNSHENNIKYILDTLKTMKKRERKSEKRLLR